MRDAGIENAVDEMLETFLADLPARLAAIRDAAESESSERTTTAAHALKSAAMMVRANSLGHLLEVLETTGREGNVDQLKSRAEDAISEARRVCDQLQRHLAR